MELRTVPASDAVAFSRALELCFGNVIGDEEAEANAACYFDPDWAIGFYDSGRLVATTSANNLELTLPAGPGAPFPLARVVGVTAVSVLPSHRRRGLLTQMMSRQLAQLQEREVPLAILTASESVIYGRYGYGAASWGQSLAIASKRSGFAERAVNASAGRTRLMDAEEAAGTLPAVHKRARALRPGEIDRSAARWAVLFADRHWEHRGASPRMFAVHEGPNSELDGYVTYRYKSHDWPHGLPGHRVEVEDLYSVSPSVDAALWRFVLDLDLVEELTAADRPLDEPLRWRLADSRQLRTTAVTDFLWLRPVDVPAMLAARGYGIETELVLEVTGHSPGRYVLVTGPKAGACSPAKQSQRTDLVLGLPELGAIYLGGNRPSVLAAAGRAQEARPGALGRADAAFASPLAPFCGTHF
jgi:predicted acetyltransferase